MREQKPTYEEPTIKEMTENELLTTFQMTAREISAAGCWWSPPS